MAPSNAMKDRKKESKFLQALDERVLILDGGLGTNVHDLHLPLEDFQNLENCTEILTLTRPDAIKQIHSNFLEAGCDAIETNTFGANKLVLSEFGLADKCQELNRRSVEIARESCEAYSTPEKQRFVIGSMGPGTKLPSLRHTTFDVLEDSYAEQVRGLLDGGADALLIETCQDILQAKTAIAGAEIAFAEKGKRLPIMVQVTVETTGTMLVGTDIAAALVTLEAYPQIDVIGLNCATGPEQMAEHVQYLSENCTRKISVVPNAGLPKVVDGEPHYPLSPDELARWLKEFVEQQGVNMVGGCCGTRPSHLKRVAEVLGDHPPKQRDVTLEPSVSSVFQATTIRQDNSFLIVGERTNANGSKKFREMLANEDVDGMIGVARDQVKQGSHMLDVCTAYVGRDEKADMENLITRMATEVTAPLMIDSTDPDVIEAALKLAGGKSIINSINLEDGEEKIDTILPLCRKYGAGVIALTIDEEGMAKTCERKVAVAERIYKLVTERHGLDPSDLLFDPLTFTICTGNEEDRKLGLETLKAIKQIKEKFPESHIILGLSNISFGVKKDVRHVLNSVFLHYAREAGLDGAIVHAAGIDPLYKIDENLREIARRLIFDERTEDYDPLADLLQKFPKEGTKEKKKKTKEEASVEERLKERIIDGDRNGIEADLDEAMQKHPPLEIINDILLGGMKVVGDLFGSGEMQLPFVLQSAETMKSAVAYLEPHMDKSDTENVKGSIVLATVKGDVHDIGKNLVDILLTNNGYKVYNIGIKQPINNIIEAWEEHQADAIGLSGLLVKSTVVMRDNLITLKERGLNPPVILGGAALNRKYVEQDLRKVYDGPLMYAKDAFEGMALMEKVATGELPAPGVSEVVAEAETAETPSTAEGTTSAAATTATEVQAPKVQAKRSDDIAIDVPVPQPPFWGSKVLQDIPLRDVLAYMNEVMLFQVQWGYKRQGRSREEFERFIENEVRPVYNDLIARCERENILQPKAIYGYWPVQSEGNSLFVYDPEDRSRELVRFDFPRQNKSPYWCLSDFWRPKSTGEYDVAGFSIVTVGPRATEIAHQWFKDDKYKDYLHLHGLSVESAEALAEYIHKQMRVELGIAGADAGDLRKLFQQGYQGSRYSFGYPACPNLADQKKLLPLLKPERIGVSLSEECQLDPEQSTSAIVAHHPQARYFKA
jgi:5-methyltetrahydrofolate--homocysteine methyltransferase